MFRYIHIYSLIALNSVAYFTNSGRPYFVEAIKVFERDVDALLPHTVDSISYTHTRDWYRL